jgi:sugar O-acyltransferase (sialic acid O-acetyltransferase NeuD family)
MRIIFLGTPDFAVPSLETLIHSEYEVVAFTVHSKYLISEKKFNLPVYPFEEITQKIDPSNHFFFAAVTYLKLNDLRAEILSTAKEMGFRPATYISSKSFVWPNVSIGEHCFIFEDNTLQPFVSLGSNVIMWSGNHIGHHSQIKDNVFISSHVVVSGNCTVEENCFVGVNATITNNVIVGMRTWIGPRTLINHTRPPRSLVTDTKSKIRLLDEELLNLKLSQITSRDVD